MSEVGVTFGTGSDQRGVAAEIVEGDGVAARAKVLGECVRVGSHTCQRGARKEDTLKDIRGGRGRNRGTFPYERIHRYAADAVSPVRLEHRVIAQILDERMESKARAPIPEQLPTDGMSAGIGKRLQQGTACRQWTSETNEHTE
jgi:hypothetical protein